MRTRVLALAAFAAAGCITGNPHSAVFGRTAVPLGAGQAEVAVSPGVSFESFSPGTSGNVSSSTSTGITFPAGEGQVAYGLSDGIDLGAHISAAGLQPNMVFSIVRGPVSVAIAPEIDVGLAHASSASVVGGGANSSLNALTIMAGAKILLSHQSGFYAGVGYDFERTSLTSDDGSGRTSASSGEDLTAHNISVAIGYSTHGALMVRPEVSLVVCPSQGETQISGATSFDNPNKNTFFVVMPSLTFAIRTGSEREAARETHETRADDRYAPPPTVK